MTKKHKSKSLSVPTEKKLAKQKIFEGYQPGDMLIRVCGYSEGQIYKILKILRKKNDPTLIIVQWNGETWEDATDSITSHTIHDYIKFDGDPATIDSQVLQAATNPELNLGQFLPEEESDDTRLALSLDGQPAKIAEGILEKAMNKALVAKAVMERKTAEINDIVCRYKEGLDKVQRVLHVAELYLGMGEEIMQIRDGEPAPTNIPISIRQMILFMDEEVGNTDDEGLDWKNVEDFDNWICQDHNVDIVLPEARGVVALQVRRTPKKYGDLWEQIIGNEENSKTYLLIRNGARLYRIWMNEHIHPRLFPRRDELIQKEDGDPGFDYWQQRDLPEKEFSYKKYGVILQGLIQRTDVFYPLPTTIDVFHPDKSEMVQFIRDDEMLLPSGRMPWPEWQKSINAEIQVGSRIIWIDRMGYNERDKQIRERTDYHGWHSAPEQGLYIVTGQDPGGSGILYKRNPMFMFLYSPGNQVRRENWNDDRPRMKRVSFRFYKDEALNYDQIDLEDIDFYLHCRAERHHYINMLPILRQVRKTRLAEKEHEKGLVTLLSHEAHVTEEEVWKAIEWWKLKNKWKRSVSQDDGKALRMIRRRLKNPTT